MISPRIRRRLSNGNKRHTAAKPLKTVSFSYDYSLCQGLPNSNGSAGADGKLTLKEVHFTYRGSQKGTLNPYKFTYSGFNPDYNQKAVDRWGNYIPPVTNCDPLDNAQWPYAIQEQTLADQYASAWNLTRIELPSTGAIEVEYQADDYGYVQDKPAMRMFKLSGISNYAADPNASQNDKLFDRQNGNSPDEQTTLDISDHGPAIW